MKRSLVIIRASVFLILSAVLGTSALAQTPSGMVGWWKGETNTVDDMRVNNGAIIGNVTYGVGKVGQGFVFDGNGDEIFIGNPTSMQNQTFSIEAWIKRASATAITKDGSQAGNVFGYGWNGYIMGVNTNGRVFLSKTGVSEVLGGSVTDTAWHHIAVSCGSGETRIYVDGVSSGALPYGPVFTFTEGASIGRAEGIGGCFFGSIDEVSVYNRVLSDSEVQAIFVAGQSGKTPLPSAPKIVTQPTSIVVDAGANTAFSVVAQGATPLAYQWYFNATNALTDATNATLSLTNISNANVGVYSVIVSNSVSVVLSSNANLTILTQAPMPSGLVSWWKGENNALDEVGGNNGTLVNNTSYGAGMVGTGFVFDGNGDEVLIGNPTNLQLQTFTIEAWIKRTSATQITMDGPNCANIFGYGWNGYIMGVLETGGVFLSKNGVNSVSAGSVKGTNWHHIAVSYGAGVARIYVDGVSSGPMSYSQVFSFTGNVAIGKADGGVACFNGAIDEVGVFNRVLTDLEIHTIFAAGKYGKEPLASVPIIVTQPVSAFVVVGGDATFSVVAKGTEPLVYQWFYNATNVLTDATNSTLSLSNLSSENVGIYSVIVSNALGTTSSGNASLLIGNAPTIKQQPQSVYVPAGGNASMSVQASGTDPIFYQWLFNDSPLSNATNSSLTLSSVTSSQTGSYRVVVSNYFGFVTSSVATLTIVTPQIFTTNMACGDAGLLSMPILFQTIGSENSVQFSLTYNASLFTFVSAQAGTNNASLSVVTNLSSLGKIGFTVALEPGSVYPFGTQAVVVVLFRVAPASSMQSSAFAFGDVPTSRQLMDGTGNVLNASYSGSSVFIMLSKYEADISPTGGDRIVSDADWQKVGRAVAGLDSVNSPADFQKIDCAPRATMGNGILSVADWTQAGRYAAGLDGVAAVGGPTNSSASGSLRAAASVNGTSRVLKLVPASLAAGVSVAAQLSAQGNENALAFNLKFDPAVLQFVSAVSPVSGATLLANTDGTNAGVLGLALALSAGSAFPAGTQNVVVVTFSSVNSSPSSASLAFTNGPLVTELAGVDADVLSMTTQVLQAARLTVVRADTNAVIGWPTSVGESVLLESDSIESNWSSVKATPVTNGSQVEVVVPAVGNQKFFRLQQN
jgi:hypothetical protein